ncbi:DUF3800 domain-containing protein [Phytoactinopolyspora limicola]|uniref:DUF3800 domain-containing protein n=1 Tax=Phytoactinopolyspora limicola TaxID=2715536 RepID=UPI00140A0387|nr:DUF3800 domain-containing protein [Phytoactinopolyspora limicola]
MTTNYPDRSEPLEIGCDESGAEGTNFVEANTDVFAHASVVLDVETAAECVRETRRRIRSPAREYKANHLLRERHRAVLEWFLNPSGPVHGYAHVHLTDKTSFLVSRVVEMVLGGADGPSHIGMSAEPAARAAAITLLRAGPDEFGLSTWQAFLQAANHLVRGKDHHGQTHLTAVEPFFQLLHHMGDDVPPRVGDGAGAPARRVVERLRDARPRPGTARAKLLDEPRMIIALDPLFPALASAIRYWSRDGHSVAVVHDEHAALTPARVNTLRAILNTDRRGVGRTTSTLVDVTLVDSRSDPRVQVADFLAGVARKIASDALSGQVDTHLCTLLRPYVDTSSEWTDESSWSALAPPVPST